MTERDRLLAVDEAETQSYETQKEFYFLFALLQGIGLVCITLVVLWGDKYLGGFAWDGSGKMFNWHPVFMIVGFVYLYGNAAIVYRILHSLPRLTIKLIHAGLHMSALVAAVIGLVAVFGFHNHNNIPNMYSIHSWVGITTAILFSCQFLFGFLGFLFPKFSDEGRRRYLAIHVYFGGIIFILSIIACVSGITEKLLFAFKDTYSHFASAAMMGNVLGIFLITFGMLVGYMLNKESQ